MAKRILIVDAEPDTVKVLALLFKQWGFEVETAFNGAEAIEVLGRVPLGGMTLGLKMPHLNGFEVLRHLRQTDQKIPVIIISGFLAQLNETDCAYEYLRKNAQALFPKPFQGDELRRQWTGGFKRHASGLKNQFRESRSVNRTHPNWNWSGDRGM